MSKLLQEGEDVITVLPPDIDAEVVAERAANSGTFKGIRLVQMKDFTGTMTVTEVIGTPTDPLRRRDAFVKK